MKFKKILIIQTAFIGDVILATPLIEKLYDKFPESKIHFLLRKGNEQLLQNHPKIKNLLIWDKKDNKYRNLFKIIKTIRATKYDLVVNLQRFATSGFITYISKAKLKAGFNKNPFSFSFNIKTKHLIGNEQHEVDRNLSLIEKITDNIKYSPRLYPTKENYSKTVKYKTKKYICIAPASVWFTKQYPKHKWIELINTLNDFKVYLTGSPADKSLCNDIIKKCKHTNIENLSGNLSLLDSAALMQGAFVNYVNDSAPLHIASAMNANVIAVFCSTSPKFGFYPLSEKSKVVEVSENLSCRPCGLHGKKTCPEGHFNCAEKVSIEQLTPYF